MWRAAAPTGSGADASAAAPPCGETKKPYSRISPNSATVTMPAYAPRYASMSPPRTPSSRKPSAAVTTYRARRHPAPGRNPVLRQHGRRGARTRRHRDPVPRELRAEGAICISAPNLPECPPCANGANVTTYSCGPAPGTGISGSRVRSAPSVARRVRPTPSRNDRIAYDRRAPRQGPGAQPRS